MYVVSGCPRSGTSLMMEIFRTALGDARVIGRKFPQEARLDLVEGDTAEMREYRRLVLTTLKGHDVEKTRDMNPDGFWECPFTVKGIHYHSSTKGLLRTVGSEDKPYVCKVVSQGLAGSNPIYVDGVVFMLRHPEAVAKSQERLVRSFKVKRPGSGEVIDLLENAVIRSPQMFIEVSLLAAQWFSDHPEIPVYIVNYEDLLANPSLVLGRLSKLPWVFHEDSFEGAASCVRQELNRSSKYTVTHPLMSEAISVYEMFAQHDWVGLLRYRDNRHTLQNRRTQQWLCLRSASMAQKAICDACMTDGSVRNSLREDAIRRGVKWQEFPCAYECAYDLSRADDQYVTFQDSVKHNHWKEEQ